MPGKQEKEAIESSILPVGSKSKISKAESYPLGAKEISEALLGIPQWVDLKIDFYRSHVRSRHSRGRWPIKVNHHRLVDCAYTHPPASIHQDGREPSWQVLVYSVSREQRHQINQLLLAEGLARVRLWLIQKSKQERLGVEGMTISWDLEKETLVIEEYFRAL